MSKLLKNYVNIQNLKSKPKIIFSLPVLCDIIICIKAFCAIIFTVFYDFQRDILRSSILTTHQNKQLNFDKNSQKRNHLPYLVF